MPAAMSTPSGSSTRSRAASSSAAGGRPGPAWTRLMYSAQLSLPVVDSCSCGPDAGDFWSSSMSTVPWPDERHDRPHGVADVHDERGGDALRSTGESGVHVV